MTAKKTAAEAEEIEHLILEVRGQEVMPDEDLALLYEVSTGALDQTVGRYERRFPSDFAFRLTKPEHAALPSRNVISKLGGRGGRRTSVRRVSPCSRRPSGPPSSAVSCSKRRPAGPRVLSRRRPTLPGPTGPSGHDPVHVCILGCMPRMQVYLPEDLYRALKERKLPASELLQEAIKAELRRQRLLDAADEHLAELVEEVGEPTADELARAESISRQLTRRADRRAAG